MNKLLADQSLGLGGKWVVGVPDIEIALLLKRGRLFPTEGRRRLKGDRHRSHLNLALAYLRRRQFDLVTGYARSGELWVPRSWGWDGERVVETTMKCEAYFGVVLDQFTVAAFVLRTVGQALPQRMVNE